MPIEEALFPAARRPYPATSRKENCELRKPLFAIAGIALLASGLFATGAANAADHRDSPSNTADAAADGTDIFAFRSPTNDKNVVLVFELNGLSAPSDSSKHVFDASRSYPLKDD